MMTDSEIGKIVAGVLSEIAPEAGFLGADVSSDFDYEGERVLRVVARYRIRPAVKPDALINAVHPIRTALLEAGEDRPVLLTNDVETERQADEQMIEEDAG